MKTILTFAGSNSSKSINRELLTYTISKIKNEVVKNINLVDLDIPMYSQDIETGTGIPENIKILNNTIEQTDYLIIAIPEHNGNFPAFFKNIIDWMSRYNRNFFAGKKILLLGTSPGPSGAANSMAIAKKSFPFFQGNVATQFSLPNFHSNFSEGKITTTEYEEKLNLAISQLLAL